MLSRRETVLVNVLAWVALLAALGVVWLLTAQRRQEAGLRIRQLEEQVRGFAASAGREAELAAERERLTAMLGAERGRFYADQGMDPYRFGTTIRDLLLANRIDIDRYQTVESAGRVLLEFSVAGRAGSILRFLQSVSESEKYWNVGFLSLNARGDTGLVQCVFRIGYETASEAPR